jgi:hypothetical protein
MTHLHLVSDAQAPRSACEATVPVPQSSSAAVPSRWKRTISSAVRLLTFAMQTAATLRADLRAIKSVTWLDVLAWMFGPAEFEGPELTTCELCERACERVIDGAYRCLPFLGQCTVCVAIVDVYEEDGKKRCVSSPLHTITNVREKPRIPKSAN